MLLCGAAHTCFSRIDQMAKSMGLTFGLEGGHNTLAQNAFRWVLHHRWVTFDVWDGSSPWINTFSSANDAFTHGRRFSSRKST